MPISLCLPFFSLPISLSFRPSRHPFLTFVNPSVELNCWPGKSVKLNDFVARRHATRRHRLTIASVNFINHARVHFATRWQTSVYMYVCVYDSNVRLIMSDVCISRSRLPRSRESRLISRRGRLPIRSSPWNVPVPIVCISCSPFIWASFLARKQRDVMFNGIIISKWFGV